MRISNLKPLLTVFPPFNKTAVIPIVAKGKIFFLSRSLELQKKVPVSHPKKYLIGVFAFYYSGYIFENFLKMFKLLILYTLAASYLPLTVFYYI